jgi:hypothetical protein
VTDVAAKVGGDSADRERMLNKYANIKYANISGSDDGNGSSEIH